jgi:hypothetical protein
MTIEYVSFLNVVVALAINTDIETSQFLGSRSSFLSVAGFKPAAMNSD